VIDAIFNKKMESFEEYRVEVYRLIMKDSAVTIRTARRNLLKAYITYAMAEDLMNTEVSFIDYFKEILDAEGALIEQLS